MRRGLLLLASGLAAGVIAPHAAGDPTSTTPAPDPNPPAGAAPDPYSPPAKTTPAPKAAPVHVAPRVYSPPHVSTPVTSHTSSSSGSRSGSVHTYTPRPVVTHTRVTHKAHKVVRHRRHRVRHVVHHKHKPVIVRVTPAVRSYVVSFVDRLSATVVAPAESAGKGRRRAAGLALVVLCAASLSLILLGSRRAREQAT